MPSNPKSSVKSRIPEDDHRALTLTLVTSEADDDDDDFQNPGEAIALAQGLILSSAVNPSSRPLRPSNGARPRKRTKPAAAAGKENRGNPQTKEFDSRVSKAGKEDKAVRLERRSPSAQIGSGSVENPPASKSDACDSSNGFGLKGITSENGSPLKRSESRLAVGCDNRDGVVGEKLCLLTLDNPNMVEKERTEGSNLKISNGGYFSMSIESRLLGLRENAVSSGVEGVCLEGDFSEDFEPGTQLSELMNLCSEMVEESDINGEVIPSELQCNGLVQCPLCGIDITDLSDEMRQIHTNNCLDKDGTSAVTFSTRDAQHSLAQQVVDVNPVREWLWGLGLTKYEEAFVRQEIDWETLQWLTEEDLLSIGIDALGPRKKIAHALNELRKTKKSAQDLDKDVPNTTTNGNMQLYVPGNKLITDYFQDYANGRIRVHSSSKAQCVKEKSGRKSVCSRVGSGNRAIKRKIRDIPPWCCVPGTPFRVDAFRYLRSDCSHWFLTHFHIDHYQGLTRSFCHGKIYCSSITAHLINVKIGIRWDRLHILPLNQKINIAGVNLTCLDANHCPGSIIILFEPPNRKAVLHTGDFRFSAEIASNPVLQSCHVNTLILDTTYCNPQYDFPKQEEVIQFVIDAIQAEAFNPKTLFLIGSYTIGKEKLYLEVARLLRKKVYVGAAKLRLLTCLELPEEDMQWFTANEMESHIHVVPMWTLASFKRMSHITNQFSGRYDLIVAFSPTGWTYGKGKKRTPGRRWQQGTIIRYEVPYSEHCSFTELREFVKLISPEHIIPSVNNDGPESANAMIGLLLSDL